MNKEEIYDSEISPLMAQIIDVCKENKIAMLATFHIPTEENPNLECSTFLLGDDLNPPDCLIKAANTIRPPTRKPLMVTTRDAAGNIVRMDAIL